MLRILIIIAVGLLIYQLFKRSKPVTTFKRDAHGHKLETKELVRDPACMMYVTKEKAIEDEGHYFCSEQCRDEYRQMPKAE